MSDVLLRDLIKGAIDRIYAEMGMTSRGGIVRYRWRDKYLEDMTTAELKAAFVRLYR